MNLIGKVFILLMLSWCFALIDAASVNVTISSQNIQNGSSLTLTAVFDPATPEITLNNLQCGYSDPAGSTFTHFTYFNTFKRQVEAEPSMSAYNKARVSITSNSSQVVLAISPITFDDEKRLFYCILRYFDADGNVQPDITSEQLRLENVYSKVVLNEADSMQTSTSLTEGVAAALTCIAIGRPAPVITWQYNLAINATITNTSVGSPLITVTSILNIGNSTQSMEGQQITCLISHAFSSPLNRTTTLIVYYRPINTTLMVYPQNPRLNEDITLSCNAIGNPNVTAYRFYINQTYIGNSTTGNFTVNANNCSQYNGYYRCIPVNARGEGEEKQQLVVVKDDVKTSTASASLTFNETEDATLFCTVSGCPEPSVVWSRNGVSLNEYGKMLMLPLLNRSHAGRYSCNANNAYTNSSSQIEVTVHYKPVGTKLTSNNTKPLVNTSVQFTCTSNAVPVAKYRFFRVDGSGEREVSSSNSDSTGSLMVSSIMYTSNTYNVTYKCIPYNMLGDGLQKTVMVDVQVPAKIDKFTLTPLIVNETGNVSIECSASGNPLPNITITGPNNVTVQHTMEKTTLRNVNRNQAGLYTCRANNGISSPVSSAMELVVNYVPEISSLRAAPPRTYTDSYSILTCIASGSPRPRYRYYHENGTLLQDAVAIIHPVTLRYEDYPGYRATFRCVPYNIMGEGAAQNVTVEILVPPRLSVSMSPNTVNETDNATFSCAVIAANPSANITLRGPLNQTLEDTSSTAILSNLTRDDAGTYSCVADNGLRGSPVIETAKLSVNHIPDQVQFTATPPKPVSGSSVTLNCMARGSPSPSFRFVLVNDSSTETVQDGASASYVIPKLDYKEYSNYTAAYQCISYNSFGESPPQDLTLDIQVHPVLSFSVTPSIVNETQNATADCQVVAANPAPNITIKGNSDQVIPNIGGQAKLERITRAQAGVYTCMADNGVGGAATSTATLNVNYAPDRVELSSSSMTPLNGSSVTLNCSSTGSPPPHRYVFSMIHGSPHAVVQDSSSSTYLIGMINFANFINYKAMFACVPYNTAGKGPARNITLDIQVRPEISVPLAVTAIEGGNAYLNCTVTAANPVASVTWRGPTNTVLSSSPHLTLSSVNRNQDGEYTCIASNGISPNARKATYLYVNYRPQFTRNSTEIESCIGDSVSITCNAVGRPMPDVLLYSDGNLLQRGFMNLSYRLQLASSNYFRSYMCVSNNTVGTVNITTTFKMKPSGSVENVKVEAKLDTIRVTWELPQCSSNIREIKVQYRKRGQTTWQWEVKAATTSSTELTIKNLEKEVEYEVRVVVTDTAGNTHQMAGIEIAKTASGTDNGPLIGGIIGGICLLIIIIIVCVLFAKKRRKSAEVLPNDPLNFSLKALGANKMLVTWDAPKHCNLNEINHFDILWKGVRGSQSVKSIKASANSFEEEIDNLRPSTPYEFRIVMVMSDGSKGRCSLSKVERTASEESLGYTNKGLDSEKGKIEMEQLDDAHYRAPDGHSVYASVKNKSENANGAIDNENFVADSDGAYEPVTEETKKKKEEGNYAELGAFVTPTNNDKPKEKPKTEYATLEELGPLKDYDDTEKPKEEEPATHKITVEPESNEEIPYAPAADPSSSAPAADSSNNGGISVNVDMI